MFGLFSVVRDWPVFDGGGVSSGLSALQNDAHFRKTQKKKAYVA